MKKIAIVCLTDDQEQSLQSLRNLASVHVLPQVQEVSGELESRRAELAALDGLKNFLSGLDTGALRQNRATAEDGFACRQECLKLMDAWKHGTDELAQLDDAIRRLSPWGQFNRDVFEKLQKIGWHYALVVRNNFPGAEKWFEELQNKPEGAVELVVSRTEDSIYSVIVSPVSLENVDLPLASFPMGDDLAALKSRRESVQRIVDESMEALKDHAVNDMAALDAEKRRLSSEEAFFAARDGMGRSGAKLCYLQGFVPEANLDALKACAQKNGWALRTEEVSSDDPEVPTKIVYPKHFGMAKTVLDFIGVLPAYNEADISVAVLIFLSIFCGMLVGDAGYGVLFCSLTALGLTKALKGGNEESIHGMQLLLGMSVCTLVWGALSGNWFGLQWGGISWLTDNERGQLNTQLFCFFLAAIHLSMAHLWKIHLSSGIRDRLGNLGWAIFLWANFFTVKALLIDHSFENFTIPKYLYIIGGALIVLCRINWTHIGDAIYSLNDMGSMMWSGNKLLLPIGILVILAGHLLNISMAAMSVLVHGIRLNTLEFSGHIGVEWGGREYRPFR
ncbi:MAG: hypothetical protein MJ106_05605 [Lentisphaeria bacterium]|nr:hypothetical protein [Lentisphaeria bacterium]